MTADSIETDVAVKALAYRLRDWGVTDPAPKARAFIDDLTSRGWKRNAMNDTARRPPRAEEECRLHRGEYAPPICRCCWADKKAARDEAAAVEADVQHRSKIDATAAARAALAAAATTRCPHGVTTNACPGCRSAGTKEDS